jgi:hypothetical protein
MRDRLGDIWAIVRGRAPRFRVPSHGPADEGDDPGRLTEARVPVGPPPTPRLLDAVALPLPEPEERDLDAYGRAADGTS